MPPSSKKEDIKKACYESLKKLNIDCIDIYYMHRMDPNAPIEITVEAFKELVEEKKIKH